MAAGYATYRGAASNKWCVAELPDDWTRDEGLPPKSFRDRWCDTVEDARDNAERHGPLVASAPRCAAPSPARGHCHA